MINTTPVFYAYNNKTNNDSYSIALLIPRKLYSLSNINTYYVNYLKDAKVNTDNIVLVKLPEEPDKKKTSAKFIKEKIVNNLIPEFNALKVKYVYCANADWFKYLTKANKPVEHLGFCLPVKDYKNKEEILVTYGINYKTIIYQPYSLPKLEKSLNTLKYITEGKNPKLTDTPSCIEKSYYPQTYKEIEKTLNALHKFPTLACDIETFSLKHYKAGIGTIAFSWTDSKGVAFLIDYSEPDSLSREPKDAVSQNVVAENVVNEPVRKLLKDFFINYTGTVIWHGATYDIKVIIYELFMENHLDTKGLLHGLEIMTNKVHCTKIISYLALNSTENVSLSLKELSKEHTGIYAVESINNILKINKKELLEYNLTDTCGTFYVYNKNYPILSTDNQLNLYETMYLPTLRMIIQMEMTGMPLSVSNVKNVEKELTELVYNLKKELLSEKVVKKAELQLTEIAYKKDYEDRKSRAKNPDNIKKKCRDSFPETVFNTGSSKHLIELIYNIFKLSVLEKTPTGSPSTSTPVLKILLNSTTDQEAQKVIKSVIEINAATKILSTFVPALKTSWIDPLSPNEARLHGSFNVGPVSGRLSSSGPNLQNIPSGSKYGELIKKCFVAPKGFLIVGADFNALEDRISALVSGDPNKLKVYIEGYDSHCLRSFSYFGKKMPEITNSVESINSITTEHPDLRRLSKTITFLLTYMGTFIAIFKATRLPEEECKEIENSFKELYKVSIQYIKSKINEARTLGYAEVAFGLRIRTPLLKRTIDNENTIPKKILKDIRTIGNAHGQSYGLLNNRASFSFMERVHKSKYRLLISQIATIHDALYFLVPKTPEAVHWLNINLIEEMRWTGLPELQHDLVKLEADLEIYNPSWAESVSIKNNATIEEIEVILNKL